MYLYIYTTYICTHICINIHTCVYMYKYTFMFIYIKYNINWVGVEEQIHSKDTGIFHTIFGKLFIGCCF